MAQADIYIKHLGSNEKSRGKFGFIVSSEGDTYGCLGTQLSQFKTGNGYRIQFHVNDKGYKEFDSIIKQLTGAEAPLPPKHNERPPTNRRDSDRMGTMGMVNGVLQGMAYARPDIDEFIANHKGKVSKLIDFLNDELHATKMHGREVQTRDDLQDEIPL